MAVNRYATAAGRRFQRDLMKYLRDARGHDCELLALTGAEDEGDVLLRVPDHHPLMLGADRRVVIEAKREKGFHLAQWMNEAEVEAHNYGKHRGIETPNFVVIHARRNFPIGKAYVTTSLDEWLRQIQ